MKIQKLFLNSQFERWLNMQVARHLEAQAATFRPLGRTDMPKLVHGEAYSAQEEMVRA